MDMDMAGIGRLTVEDGLVKLAETGRASPYYDAEGVLRPRDLSAYERKQVAQGRKQVMPSLIDTTMESPASNMASPWWAAAGGAAAGGAVGALAGHKVERLARGSLPDYWSGMPMAAGGALGAIVGAIHAARKRYKKNDEIENRMRYMPRGVRQGDIDDADERSKRMQDEERNAASIAAKA